MRRPALVACCFLAFAVPAQARAAVPPAISATPAAGAAPLTVALTASGGSGSYQWDLGDGTFADGATVQHVYAAGTWIATVTTGGETATVAIRAEAVLLSAPGSGRYGQAAVFTGAVVPSGAGTQLSLERNGRILATGVTTASGGYRLRLAKLAVPGPYVVRTALTSSSPAQVLVRPQLSATFAGTPLAGNRFTLVARLEPASAGRVKIRVWLGKRLIATHASAGSVRLPLRSATPATVRVTVTSAPAAGYLVARTTAQTVVVASALRLGAHGPSVRVLEQRLVAMHYALQRIDGTFESDTADAVLAFQKVHGLARTGQVDPTLWKRLLHAAVPAARSSGTHIEVDKTRQVLFEVRDGAVVLVVHVSTGATGNTPVGVWHVYRRVAGFDWVLYYPTYFLRGFAIHGYPSVPAYPASHGCVRVPMWVAQRLYSLDSAGETVIVYA